jgi:ABC-2 type transport system ATP-binding protein
MAAIVVESLRKRYGAHEAVRGVSFQVAEGEVFALLGPNGAGKTTTVEILEGFRRRDAGRVAVLGGDPDRDGPRLRERIGIVLQECGIEEALTVREALARQAGYFPAPRPVEDVLALVELADRAGAQRRRLDLALALVGDPELIFLDEPTTGFDPAARRNAWALVKSLCGLGKTVLLTTHYMDEAQALADRVAVMAGGRIVAEGPPDTLGGRHASASRIRFRLPAGRKPADLPLPAAGEGDSVVVRTEAPTRDLHALTSWALAEGVELAGLSVSPPSLEDVYLELIGEAGS